MDKLKSELVALIKSWQGEWTDLRNGKKATIEEVAARMDYTRVHLTRLLSKDYPIDEKILKHAKNSYRDWRAEFIETEKKQNVSHETFIGHEQDAAIDLESRRSLERTLENLSEDKIRSTAIIERLVALLEEKFSSRKQPVAEGAQNELKGSVAEAEQELARTGRSGPFSFPKEVGKADKKGKTNK